MSSSVWLRALYSPWTSPGQNAGVGTFPFSRRPSQPTDWTQVSRIAGRAFTGWAAGKPIAPPKLFGQESFLPGSELGVMWTPNKGKCSVGWPLTDRLLLKTHPVCGGLFRTAGYIKILHCRVMHMFSIFSPNESLYIGCQKNYCRGTAHTIWVSNSKVRNVTIWCVLPYLMGWALNPNKSTSAAFIYHL